MQTAGRKNRQKRNEFTRQHIYTRRSIFRRGTHIGKMAKSEQQEMALWSHKEVNNESLDKWEIIGSGGFGYVYKARHKDWKFDVAIKILRELSCPSIAKDEVFKEANHMESVSCKYVVKVLGIYKGRPQVGVEQIAVQKGIVMEFMERGSLQSLLEKPLLSPLPWPLPLRLAYEVALGMNFLHSKGLLHQDLKPSNVLLDENLTAKLADFGLCRVSTSALKSNQETTGMSGGSYKYMPPEAFKISYKPVRDFDTYSYGILLWSLVTGKEPYPECDYKLVAWRIPEGDRPLCDEIDLMNPRGVEKMVELMKECWDPTPSKRPKFGKIADDLTNEFSKHKGGIHSAVQQVLTRLDSPNMNEPTETTDVIPPFKKPEESVPVDFVDGGHLINNTENAPVQDSDQVPTERMSDADKASFVDKQRASLIQTVTAVMEIIEELGNMVHPETYSTIESKPTPQGKMRELYQTSLRSGGVKVKAAFYDALQKHHCV